MHTHSCADLCPRWKTRQKVFSSNWSGKVGFQAPHKIMQPNEMKCKLEGKKLGLKLQFVDSSSLTFDCPTFGCIRKWFPTCSALFLSRKHSYPRSRTSTFWPHTTRAAIRFVVESNAHTSIRLMHLKQIRWWSLNRGAGQRRDFFQATI